MMPRTTVRADARLPLGALVILAAIGFTSITTELLPAGLLPQISSGFGISEAQVGYLATGYAGIIVVTVLPLTKVLARFPRKMLLVSLVVAMALSNILIAISPTFGIAVSARLIGGIAHGLLWSLMAPFVSRLVPELKVGKALAIVFSGNNLGLAVGTPLGTALGTVIGWREAFLSLGGAGALLALLALWLLPRGNGAEHAPRPSLRLALARKGVLLIAIAWPLMLLARFALFTYIAPFISAAGLPSSTISFTLSIIGISGLAGLWIAGITVDRYPRRGLLAAIALVGSAYVVLPILGGNLACFIALMFLWGAGLSASGIYNQTAILRAGGPHRDAANSLQVLTTQLGIAVGALYGGFALTLGGGLMLPWVAAVPAFLAIAIIFCGRSASYPPGPGERKALQPASPAG
ncbi:MFS transporter [Arthrobacter sedimenti]|uniref:MFS transporter n=1 Tax=Arthrobacter sedimenti TaxID=2694931 RepID=UPI000B358D6F|nr:MFS transporter [Arthrobacter sedimenti]OUM40112.1 MFS transporter [Arthrobacter agilis]